jgi:iron complex outermembrane receptor protein
MTDPAYNPRVGLIYHPMDTATLKALYGQSFRVPNFLELVNSPVQLDPEKITSYELVYEQEIGRHFRSSVSGFYNDLSDLIVFSSGQFNNFDAETAGAEVALDGSWTNGIRGRLSYSYQHTHNHGINWAMPDSPEHQVKFNLSVPLYRDKIFGSVELQYLSGRRTLHNTYDVLLNPVTVQGEDVGEYAIVNLTLFSQNLIKDLEFSASVYNVFDTHYSDPATKSHIQDALEREGRSFRVKLTYRF